MKSLKEELKVITDQITLAIQTFDGETSNRIIWLILMILSSLICSIGINFNNFWIIALSMVLFPGLNHILGFSVAAGLLDIKKVGINLLYILASILIAIFISFVYFQLTPFAYNSMEAYELSKGSLGIYPVCFIMGFVLFFTFLSPYRLLTFSLTNIISQVLLWSCLIGFSFKIGDDAMLISLGRELFLSIFFLFLGVSVSFGIFFKSPQSQDQKIVIFRIIKWFLIFIGLYTAFMFYSDQTTQYNVQQYLDNELESPTFHVSNVSIDKPSKEVYIYYSGRKPTIIQDEAIKQQYHIQGYHFEFKEIER